MAGSSGFANSIDQCKLSTLHRPYTTQILVCLRYVGFLCFTPCMVGGGLWIAVGPYTLQNKLDCQIYNAKCNRHNIFNTQSKHLNYCNNNAENNKIKIIIVIRSTQDNTLHRNYVDEYTVEYIYFT